MNNDVSWLHNGYKYVKVGDRIVGEHRLIMEKNVGRKLNRNEFVHHINENKLDNRMENLKIMNNIEHRKHHMAGRKNPMFGKVSPRPGKKHSKEPNEKNRIAHLGKKSHMVGLSLEKVYGKEKADEIKKKQSIAMIGKTSWNKGLSWSEETKLKI